MKTLLKQVLRKLFPGGVPVDTTQDQQYLSPDVPMSELVSHEKWQSYLYELANKPGMRVLEIGSREVCMPSDARQQFDQAEYVGFDYYAGNNVDVVGDVHQLSSYFDDDEKFDLVYTSACFEHFAMPWIVATEIAKVLKVGGTLFIKPISRTPLTNGLGTFFNLVTWRLKSYFQKPWALNALRPGYPTLWWGVFRH